MSSLTNYWKRFMSTCATPTTSAGNGPSLASNYVGSNSVTTTSQNSLQKSSVEWQCLNETVNVLLKTCPVSRSAILDHLAPLYIDYFVVWWHVNSGTTSHNSNFESQNIRKAEVVLQEFLKTINLLITQESVTDHFLTAACSWCLMLIRPVCTASPTQLLSNLMDLLKSLSRQQDNDKSSSTSRKTLNKSGTHSDSSAGNKISDRNRLNVMKSTNCRYDLKHKSDYNSLLSSLPSTPYHQLIVISDSDSCSSSSNDESDALAGEESTEMGVDVKRNDGMVSSSISRDAIETSQIKSLSANIDKRDELNSTINSSNGQEISLNSNDQIFYSSRRHDFNGDEIIDLDLNPTSAVNQQILGLWVKCPVLIDLLNIICNCLLGPDIRLCSVQALLASSTVPIWDNSLENCHSLANSVLPHWVMIWVLYQATRQKNLMSAGIHKLNELCDLILTCALHPFKPNILQCTLLPDTLAGYFSQKNFDFDFWITVCLTHLLFLGDSVPEFLDSWLRTKLEPLSTYALLISNEASLNNDNVIKQNPLIHQPKLLHLLLNLSLISVPILPQSASEQQIPLTNSSETTDLGIDRLWRHPHPPKSTSYGIPSISCRSTCVSTETECTPIPPRFNVPPKHMNPMLSTSCHIPLPSTNIMNANITIGQPNFIPFRFNFSQQFEIPTRRPPPPSPLLHVPVNILPNRSTSNDTHSALTSYMLHFSEHQSRNFPPSSGADRQPTSLLWILSLIRRIKSVTLSIMISSLITLTPLQLFALFRNQYESNYHSVARMIQLFVKSILQAPVGSNVDRLLVYLINICDLELPQSCSTPTFIITSTATTIESNTTEEANCSDSKKIKLDSDDQLSQRQYQSVLEYHKFFNKFQSYCREILRLLCETTIFLTYSSSETADLLDRGGCEGLLREALHLANHPSISSLNNCDMNDDTSAILSDYLNCKLLSFSNSKCYLFRKLISSNSLQNSTCAQLILSLGFTLDPSLMEYLLFYLCCWRSTPAKISPNDDSFKSPVSIKSYRSSSSLSQSTYCPLMLFFPILNEIQSIWVSRTFSRPPPLSTTTVTTASTTTSTSTITAAIRPSVFPIMSIRSKYLLTNSHRMDVVSNGINNTHLSFLSPNGLLYIHQLLASKFFPLLWSSLEKGNHEFRIRLLRNLLWLVHREFDLVAENFSHPRILFALAAQLDEIVNMMRKNVYSECLDLLLSLCECIFSTFQFPPTNHLLRSTTPNSKSNQSVKPSGSSCCYHRLSRFYYGPRNKSINTNSRLRGFYYDSHQTFALIHLSPAQCIRLANSFVQLLSRLMLMVNESNLISDSSSLSSCVHFYLLGRFRNLLNLLFNSIQSKIFHSTTMRLISKVIMSSRVNPYIDDLLKIKMPTPINNFSGNLFNSNISCLSSNLFINAGEINTSKLSQSSDNNSLLINNPPKRFGYLFDDDQDGLIRGQLQPRINNNINHHNFIVQKGFKNTRVLIHRGPGEGLLGSDYHSTENRLILTNNEELDALDCRLSGWLHWLNLVRFIIMNEKHLYQFCNVEFWNYLAYSNVNSPMQRSDHFTSVQLKQLSLLNNNHQLISGLEDIAIQGSSSIHLPQTSITCLPLPSMNLVLPPSGVVLERVLCILYWLFPEAKRLMTNNNITTTASITADSNSINSSSSSSNNQSIDVRNKLSQFSSQGILELSVILEKINLKTYGFPPLYHPLPTFASYFTESSALDIVDPLPLLSTPKVLLGLLMGLEAVWASPLAPRISVAMAIKCLTHLNNATYVEQSFPVLGLSDVCKAHAHKIIVDYAHRRLDTNSTIFKFTNKLLLYLMEVCCLQDCLETKQQQQIKNKISFVSSKFPWEQLVKCTGDNWQHNFVTTQFCGPLDCLLHCLTPRELAILLSDIRRNLRLRMSFYHIKQQKAMNIFFPGISGIYCDRLSLTMMLNPLPPTPAFITPGLLIALIQAHLMEDGIADCLGSLIHSMEVLTQYIATTNQQLINEHNKSLHSNSRRSTAKQSLTDCNVIKIDNSDTIIDINVEETEENDEDLEEEQDTIVEKVNVDGEEIVIVK